MAYQINHSSMVNGNNDFKVSSSMVNKFSANDEDEKVKRIPSRKGIDFLLNFGKKKSVKNKQSILLSNYNASSVSRQSLIKVNLRKDRPTHKTVKNTSNYAKSNLFLRSQYSNTLNGLDKLNETEGSKQKCSLSTSDTTSVIKASLTPKVKHLFTDLQRQQFCPSVCNEKISDNFSQKVLSNYEKNFVFKSDTLENEDIVISDEFLGQEFSDHCDERSNQLKNNFKSDIHENTEVFIGNECLNQISSENCGEGNDHLGSINNNFLSSLADKNVHSSQGCNEAKKITSVAKLVELEKCKYETKKKVKGFQEYQEILGTEQVKPLVNKKVNCTEGYNEALETAIDTKIAEQKKRKYVTGKKVKWLKQNQEILGTEQKSFGNEDKFQMTLKCSKCSVQFKSNEKLQYHMAVCSSNTLSFPCSQCSSSFSKKCNLNIHVKTMHLRIRPFQCEHCEKDFPKNCDLLKHISGVHLKIRPFKCSEPNCLKAFGNKTRLVNHVNQVHLKLKPYKCPFCSKFFGSKEHVKTHIKCVHEKIKNCVCDLCGASFVMRGDLNKHIRAVHLKEKSFKCPLPECSSLFTFEKEVSRHYNHVHLKVKPFKCSLCPQSFSSKCGLQKHVFGVHDKLRPYHCKICNSKFGCKTNLEFHMNSAHLNIKPYKCELCDGGYSSRDCLKKHIDSIHFQLKPYTCNHCDKSFALKKKMKNHIRGVHMQIRPFLCQMCPRKFSCKKNLLLHTNSLHLKLKQYKCDKCDNSFAFKSKLRKHLQNHF